MRPRTPLKGRHTNTQAAPAGASFEFGSMRNRPGQNRPGKPVPFGERPPGRPMADQLGNGKSYAGFEGDDHRNAGSDRAHPYFTRALKTPVKPALALRKFSWEQL